jgi:uncharacterized membrane protein (UPF0127 family)
MAGTAIVRIGDREWQVSVATTPAELTSGLGGVASLAPGTGMLFDLGYERPVQVTTEPMLFALDIVFIAEDLTVLDVVRSIEPGNIVSEDTPTRYFLEVNTGEAEGVETGDAVIAEGDQIPTTGWLEAVLPILGLVGAGVLISAALGPLFHSDGGSKR